MYDELSKISEMSMKNWLTNEVFSLGWFLMVGILAVVYTVWFILLDKKRVVMLLLIGALAAVFYSISNTIMTNVFNVIDYKIRLFPIYPPIFIAAATVTPILIMLLQQYTSNWLRFIIWTGIGLAFICFVLFPIYRWVGIAEMHKGWNYLYQFLYMLVIAIITRVVFLWIVGVQHRSVAKEHEG